MVETMANGFENTSKVSWCSGITSASHAVGPGFEPQWNQSFVLSRCARSKNAQAWLVGFAWCGVGTVSFCSIHYLLCIYSEAGELEHSPIQIPFSSWGTIWLLLTGGATMRRQSLYHKWSMHMICHLTWTTSSSLLIIPISIPLTTAHMINSGNRPAKRWYICRLANSVNLQPHQHNYGRGIIVYA